jgi:hypothetical protein
LQVAAARSGDKKDEEGKEEQAVPTMQGADDEEATGGNPATNEEAIMDEAQEVGGEVKVRTSIYSVLRIYVPQYTYAGYTYYLITYEYMMYICRLQQHVVAVIRRMRKGRRSK